MPRSRSRRAAERSLIVLALTLSAALPAAPAAAQGCAGDWSRPVVCTVELSASAEGERRSTPVDGRTLVLPTRARIELYADPIDQWGRRFPLERFELRADADRSCDDLVSLALLDEGRLQIETGSRTGACDLLLWVPGNLNLDRELRIEVSRGRGAGYSRTEAEVLAGWLYRAILGRDVEAGGLRGATMEIQRGELRSQVEAMVRSPEFRQRRAGLPAEQLLEDAYEGLLGRLPDSAGVRSYLPRVQRGDLAGVVLTLLDSEELEARLDRELD
jgi:hypothetical protein